MKVRLDINSKKYDLFLGVGSNHDFSGCLVKNGKIVKAIEGERINRLKHSLDAFNPFSTVLKYFFQKDSAKIAALATCDTLNPKYFLEYNDQVKLYNHHLCHSAAVYYTSPFKQSAIFVGDGLGSVWDTQEGGYRYETYSYYLAENGKIDLLGKQFGEAGDSLDEAHLHHIFIPNSIGLFYNYITKIIGFSFLDDGKTMGLSAYGNPNKFYKQFISLFEFKEKGLVNNSFNREDVEYYSNLIDEEKDEQEKFKLKADIAASCQKVFEECYFYCLNYLYEKTRCKNLCLSGGIVLNSVANGKIKRHTPFEKVHYFPACGDDSIAVGAALLSYHEFNPSTSKRLVYWQTPFLGKDYTENQIEPVLRKRGLSYKKSKRIYQDAAKFIAEGKIVGWFQDGSEFGPRALGHRSILADPRRADMKNILNERVKHREFFRPFAPAILEESVNTYFDNVNSPSHYMLEVYPVRKEMISKIPAVVHIDGTVRLQTVGHHNQNFYQLIKEFYKLTGIPVVLNTSFNVNKKPIVETPEDAVECFLHTGLDILAIGDFLCVKSS